MTAQATSGTRWGDYLWSAYALQSGSTWAGTGFAVIEDPPFIRTQSRVVWFGRASDTPPPMYGARQVVHVNHAASGREYGTAGEPYRTMAAGVFATSEGDTIRVVAGNYPAPVVISGSSICEASGGAVTIGE